MQDMIDELARSERVAPSAGAKVQGDVDAASNRIRARAFAIATAVIGGRYLSVSRAIEVLSSSGGMPSMKYVQDMIDELMSNNEFVNEAKEREAKRYSEKVSALRQRHNIGMDRRTDSIWLEVQHAKLLELGADALGMEDDSRTLWRWTFEEAEHDEKRYFA